MTRQLDVGSLAPADDGDVCSDGLAVVGRVRRALGMVRDPASTAQLVDRIPVAAAALGFDCAVYGHLAGSRWRSVASFGCPPVPDVGTVALDPRFAEHVAVEHRTPVSVDEGHEHRLLPAAWCRAYVVVPVVERGVVLGLIHAGHHGPTRVTGALDCELLSTFAEALGACFASARALDTLRDLVTRMAKAADEFGGPTPGPDDRDAGATAALTARELEVLELMAAGQTNGQIARRLVITEGTAKSHVKRIMRKLRAANRAEAVAAWIRPADRVLVGVRPWSACGPEGPGLRDLV